MNLPKADLIIEVRVDEQTGRPAVSLLIPGGFAKHAMELLGAAAGCIAHGRSMVIQQAIEATPCACPDLLSSHLMGVYDEFQRDTIAALPSQSPSN